MKKKQLFTVLSLTCAITLLTGGCGIKESLRINDDFSSKLTLAVYYTEQEIKDLELDKKDLTRTTLDGKTYYMTSESEKLNVKDTKSSFAALTGSKMEMTLDSASDAAATDGMSEEELAEAKEMLPFATLDITLPKPVLATNGTLSDDQKTVTYDLMTIKPNTRLYAAMSEEAISSTDITVSGVKDQGLYKKAKTVKVNSPGIIRSLKINGKEIEKNSYKAAKSKKYTVKIALLSGAQKTVKFTIDKTKPAVNVKNKTYRKAVTIKFSDKLSGIRKATLNGKAVKNKKTVKKNGSYTLKVTDKAGNTKTVKFKIKK